VVYNFTGLGTGAVSVAVIWALAVLWAGVPTLALVNLFGRLANLGQPVKNIALAATELVGLLIVIAREIISAVCGMGVDGMGLEEVLRSYNISSGTAESINLIENFSFTKASLVTSLLRPDTTSNLDIKNERVRTRELKSSSIVALDIFVTHAFIWEIENTVCFLTLLIPVRGRFLDKLPSATVDIVG